MVFAKLDIPIYYAPLYIGSNADFIWWALLISDVNKQAAIFRGILMNIMQNFVPNETIICDDRDPPWMNKEIKQLTEYKKQFYKRFIWSRKTLLYINHFKAFQDELGFWTEWEIKKSLLFKVVSEIIC